MRIALFGRALKPANLPYVEVVLEKLVEEGAEFSVYHTLRPACEEIIKEEFKEANKEKLEELKQNYYLRKARRERWVEFREANKSRAFSDYYKGWDLFEEDPDEELFQDPDNPAAVQDQSAFDAMAKDIETRSADRKAQKEACSREREAGNLAFKACQYSEALAVRHHHF